VLSHLDIWAAIDRLGERQGLTPSGLARRAGLDPTTFNRSKRQAPDGRPRWPSTESIAKILAATGTSFAEFAALAAPPGLPTLPLSRLGDARFDVAGRPAGAGWNRTSADPAAQIWPPQGAFGLRVENAALAPLYKAGDVLLAVRTAKPSAGGRVVLRTRDGAVLLGTAIQVSDAGIALAGLADPDATHEIAADDIDWIARILWASQ